MATEYNITLDQGTDHRLLLTLTDNANEPINLDGYQFAGQARTSFGAKTAAFVFTFDLLNQNTNKGKLWAKIPANSTSVLGIVARTTYVYDVEMTSPQGEKTRLFEGRIILRPEVTR
jgi:hypothetical protein